MAAIARVVERVEIVEQTAPLKAKPQNTFNAQIVGQFQWGYRDGQRNLAAAT